MKASSDDLKFPNFLCIKDTFLELPPEQWVNDDDFQEVL